MTFKVMSIGGIDSIVREACAAVFAEMQGHAPSNHYEDGYSDACAACAEAAAEAVKKYHDGYRESVEGHIKALVAELEKRSRNDNA